MRWTRSFLALALATAPLLLNAQTREQGDAGMGAVDAAPASTVPVQPTVRKSLMGMVMGALIQSAEQKNREEALARAAIPAPNPTEPKLHETGIETPSLVPKTSLAQEDASQAQVAVQVDDTP